MSLPVAWFVGKRRWQKKAKMTMTTAADVMRRRLRAPLITLGIGGVVLVAFAAVLNRGGPTNDVQAFAGQATETSGELDDTTTSAVETSTSTSPQQDGERAAPTQAEQTTASTATPITAAAAPTTVAPTTAAPTTAAPTTAAPTTAAPTTAAPTTAAPTTAAPTTAAPTTAAPTTAAPSGPKCDPNYSGCVPIASDVDCAGGSGDGPAYVEGPINVIGTDIYGLDRDKDGIACE